MEWLREKHVRINTEITNFWKAQDGWYGWEDMFRMTKDTHKQQENATILEKHYETSQPPMVALSTSNSLQRLPRESRDLVFEYVIKVTPDSEFLGQPQRNNKNYSVLKSHLLNAPCLALNKQYCAEYLTVLLRGLESGVGAQDTETLDDCLRIINLLFKIAGAERVREKPNHHINCEYICLRRRNDL